MHRTLPLFPCLLMCTFTVALADPKPSDGEAARELYTVDLKTIRKLVAELASDSAVQRANAERRLLAIGAAVTGELTKASSSTNAPLAERAAKILAKLPKPNHWLLDASGKPIPRAALEFFRLEKDDDVLPKFSYAKVTTNDGGGFAFPALPTPARVAARVVQAGYGIAMVRLSQSDVERASKGQPGRIRTPLVTGESDYGKRAVHGKVVDEDGKPVFGAEIRCTSVRTPGEGLINPIYPLHNIVTAKDGSFRLYLPNREPGNEDRVGRVRREDQQRGKLIQKNSRFNLEIRVLHEPALFPVEQYVGNTKPATIRLKRATLKHQFEFEDPKGGVIKDAEKLRWITVTCRLPSDAERSSIKLDRRLIRDGGLLIAGDYAATYHDGRGGQIEWQVLRVSKDSPEKLTFKIPPPVVFSGRVVDGTTGKPVAEAFVGGWSSGRKNLALLTPAQWTALEKLPANPSIDSPALKPLLGLYKFMAIVRTDEDGKFKLVQPRNNKFYAVMAFARDRLPFDMGVHGFREQLKKGPKVDTGDIPLFPAARLRVHPVFDPAQGQRLSLSPHWRLVQGGQPDWFSKFKAATNSVEQREFSYIHWMKLNQEQPILVPADVRFRIEFRCPYDDKWVPDNRQQVYQLLQGAEADFGKLTFHPAVEVQVLVVGPAGEPVEGAPVRRLIQHGKQRAWSVAHNSDAQGIARFHVPPNGTGKFGVYYHLRRPAQKIEAVVDFKAADFSPDKPFRIKLTKQQIETLRGAKP